MKPGLDGPHQQDDFYAEREPQLTLLRPVAGYWVWGHYRMEEFHRPSAWHRFWMKRLLGLVWEDVWPLRGRSRPEVPPSNTD